MRTEQLEAAPGLVGDRERMGEQMGRGEDGEAAVVVVDEEDDGVDEEDRGAAEAAAAIAVVAPPPPPSFPIQKSRPSACRSAFTNE